MVDYRIYTFLTLNDTMNYRKTAEKLRLSQPAVSQQIRGLEEEYGCKLFVYDGRRLHRTPQAKVLLEHARAAVYNEQQMRAELAHPLKRTVRIGATKTIGEFVVEDALCKYALQTQNDITIMVDNTETLLNSLQHEELDFALIEGAFDKTLYGHSLYQPAQFLGMCHTSHPFANTTISLDDLQGQTIVLREEGSGTRDILEKTLEEFGYSCSIFDRVICANNFDIITTFVENNVGITFAYSPVAKDKKQIAFFHLDCLHESREFNIVYLKGTNVDTLVKDTLSVDT